MQSSPASAVGSITIVAKSAASGGKCGGFPSGIALALAEGGALGPGAAVESAALAESTDGALRAVADAAACSCRGGSAAQAARLATSAEPPIARRASAPPPALARTASGLLTERRLRQTDERRNPVWASLDRAPKTRGCSET